MNFPVTTKSLMRNQHGYSTVETVKYLDAFPRQKTDPMSAGFKFGYWGQSEFKAGDAALEPSRSCLPDSPRSRARKPRERSVSPRCDHASVRHSWRVGPEAPHRGATWCDGCVVLCLRAVVGPNMVAVAAARCRDRRSTSLTFSSCT
jgi:hypothetical protein